VLVAVRPLESCCGGGVALLTNWISFASGRVTLGENCREELHIPLNVNPLDEAPPNMVIGIVFREREHLPVRETQQS
jgi:hypothetical protein